MKNRSWVGCPVEEEFFGDDRKLSKQERKLATAKDRSQYKKTDKTKRDQRQEKQSQKLDRTNLLEGRVLSVKPQGVVVEHEGVEYICNLKGLLKKEKGLLKNLVTVGDFVLFQSIGSQEGTIAHIEPRKTILSRADNLSRRKEQLIAANIDQVIITVSVVSPELKPTLVDRYIIATKIGGMNPIIVVNKMDLLKDESFDEFERETEQIIYDEFVDGYKAVGIPVVPVSVASGEGLDDLRAFMKDKASVFSGQSGVGKSSLIAAITGREIRVGKVVDRTGKGAHTTTTTQLIPLEFGGWCIDTPGIKSFGVWDLSLNEIEQYFEEIFNAGHACKFPDCTHTHEEGCAVIEGVEAGTISALRYESYVSLMESVSAKHVRR